MKKIIMLLCCVLLIGCTTSQPQELITDIEPRKLDRTIDHVELDNELVQGVWSFLEKSKSVLSEDDSVYSPLSLYLSLSMLLPATQGSTREELLSGLYEVIKGEQFEHSLAPLVKKLNVLEDEYANLMTNSIWLSDQRNDYDQEIMKKLAETYLATSHLVDFRNSEETSKTIKAFIDKQTGGFLKDLNIKLSEETMVALINTLYFKDRWNKEFVEDGTIHFEGKDVSSIVTAINYPFYVKNDQYEMVSKSYQNGDRMLFIKPSGDLNDFVTNFNFETLYDEIYLNNSLENSEVILRMPAVVDVSSNHSKLKDMLAEVGFSDLMSDNPDLSFVENREVMMFISNITQNARIKVDKKGTEAAAVTITAVEATAAPEEKKIIEMTLDKPYLMIVLSRDNLPLFITKVTNPL